MDPDGWSDPFAAPPDSFFPGGVFKEDELADIADMNDISDIGDITDMYQLNEEKLLNIMGEAFLSNLSWEESPSDPSTSRIKEEAPQPEPSPTLFPTPVPSSTLFATDPLLVPAPPQKPSAPKPEEPVLQTQAPLHPQLMRVNPQIAPQRPVLLTPNRAGTTSNTVLLPNRPTPYPNKTIAPQPIQMQNVRVQNLVTTSTGQPLVQQLFA